VKEVLILLARYNLACLYAIQKKSEKSKKYLMLMFEHGELYLSDLFDEEDFQNVRSEPWFAELVEMLQSSSNLERDNSTFDYFY
jgi:hypothetical protein